MTDTDITIRPAGADDVPVLAAHEPEPGTSSVAEHLAAQEAGDAIFATAWAGDEPLGWCLLNLAEGELQPELSHLWVLPQARRRGVGRELTRWLEAQAAEAGFREVFLLVDPENSKAIPLYLDLDYSATGDHQLSTDLATGKQGHHAIYRKSLTIR